ncbi:MAG TPA: SIMPL domain-containing protein [Candidatus Dormibacteraeota bacterium]|nr:SIMPL domain-containing protein [Candidatus Dormibacteraeota bacterium]
MAQIERPLISVRGEATLEVEPEIVQVTITVTARDPRRERALERLSTRNRECLDLLKAYGDAVEKVETTGLAVYPELAAHGRKEPVRAYRGTVRIDATIVDFAIVGELVSRVADGEMTTVGGPWWRLRPDSPVHRRARTDAAREAVARAREYAEALGTRLTGLVELADEGLSTSGVERAQDFGEPMVMTARARATAAPEPPPIDLEPQRQVVRAAVEARFTVSQPERL